MSNTLKQSLIFGGGKELLELEVDQIIEQEFDNLDKTRDSDSFQDGSRKPSAYVEVLEAMVNTVLEFEHSLLTDEEIKILQRFMGMCYNSRYCLTRLVLRKATQWHPISSLEGYKKEIGKEGLSVAVHDLCLRWDELFSQESVKLEQHASSELEPNKLDIPIKMDDGHEIIDLSMDSDEEDVNPSFSIPCRTANIFDALWPQTVRPYESTEDSIQSVLHSDFSAICLDRFCENESIMTTREILGRINKDQLTGLAKEMKCKIGPNFKKDDIVNCLLRHAVNQRVLDFNVRPLSAKAKGKRRDSGQQQTLLSNIFVKEERSTKRKTTQERRLRELAIKRLGPCIRINSEFFRLVRRLHIICYRETEHPTALLLPALLSTFKKRNYTPYTPNRTDQVWTSREDLLEYERALELDKLLDDIMEKESDSISKRATETPVYRRSSFATPVTPGAKRSHKTPLRTPGSVISHQFATPGSDLDGSVVESIQEEAVIQLDKKEKIKQFFSDWIYHTWQNYVVEETQRGVRPRPIGLERFDPGHVYTRMVHKATKVFGPLQDFELELETLDALLDQRFWGRGKRARWYTRRALVLKHLAGKEQDKTKKGALHLRSLEGIKMALLDDDTGIVHRPGLVRRLIALENILKIPSNERSRCAGELRSAPIVELKAVRVHVDPQNRLSNEKENTPRLDKYITVTGKENLLGTEAEKFVKKTGKSSWKGRDDQVVNVETRALEHYEDQGYKGFHCETRILTTIFGLLFWDIIFADVPGAFETRYQTAPLDLLYDSFYRARKKIIDKRLQEIRDGKGCEILQKHDEAYRDKMVVCVGVSWDLCTREDLLDIVDCIGGETLGIICQLFCEDYEGRRSGAPDLFVWHVAERKCKFVEVKGPNDRPQENQKFWFDALLRANADVELCKVIDINEHNPKKRRHKTPASARRRSAVVFDDFESEERDYDKLDCEKEYPDGYPDGDVLEQGDHPTNGGGFGLHNQGRLI